MQLTYDEIIDIRAKIYSMEKKAIPRNRSCTMYESSDLKKTLEYFSPIYVEVTIRNDDISLKTNLNINQTLLFTKKSFF